MGWNEFDAAVLARIPPERLVSDPDLSDWPTARTPASTGWCPSASCASTLRGGALRAVGVPRIEPAVHLSRRRHQPRARP